MKTTYDYSPLDSFFERLGWDSPRDLDETFRDVHSALTRALVVLQFHDIRERINLNNADVHVLDEFFQEVGKLKPAEETVVKLSQSEIEDMKRWRDINRTRDLLGDVKQMNQHRRNLKEAFAGTQNPEVLKTWEALDAQLESDIRFAESLTADVGE